MVRPLVKTNHEIDAILGELWQTGKQLTEREARKIGFRGDSTRFYERKLMWGKRNTIKREGHVLTAKDVMP